MMPEINGVEIDEKKALRLAQKIILMEGHNLREKEKNDAEMVKAIMKMIEEEVKCY